MKSILLLIALSFQSLYSQTISEWIALNSNTTNYLTFVHYPTASVGYVVGEQGTILKTTNSGSSWVTLSSGTNRWLSGVFFTSENVGYVSGAYNTLLKTTNGGSNWFQLSTSSAYDMQAVFFVTDNIGFITDDDGKIWKTTNAGSSWMLVYDTGGSALYSLFFLDNNNGFACGVQGKFLKTTNGGDSWSLTIIEASVPLNKVQFVNNSIGYIVANFHVYKTTNGGSNWIEIRPIDIDFQAVFFTDVNKGFIGGWQGYVYRTLNGGVTWNSQNVPASDYINSMFFIDDNVGYAVGGQGKILKFLYKSLTLSAPNGGEVWQVGSTYNIEWNGINVTNITIEYSTNNGSSWISIISNYPQSNGSYSWQIPNTPSTNSKVKIKDSNNSSVYDISNGTFTISSAINVISPNGGEQWPVGGSKDITWNAPNVTNVKLDYTTNNGSSWILINSSVLGNNGIYSWTIPNTISSSCKVRISDVNNLTNFDLSDNEFSIIQYPSITVLYPNGYEKLEGSVPFSIHYNSIAVDSVMIHYSIDSGASWILIISSSVANGNYTWIVPNINSQNCLIKVTDTGDINNYDVSDYVFEILSVSWYQQNSNVWTNLYSIDMFSSTLGYSCGDNGSIAKTTNGGENWEKLTTAIQEDLYSINFISENTGWVIGQNGLILKTTNGGLSWTYQNSNVSSTLYSSHFVNQNTGWIVGSNGTILKTSDMGNTWISQQSNVSVQLNSVFFNSETLGWAIGSTGTYLKTTNGGNTWMQQTVGTSVTLHSILFNNSLNGFIAGNTGWLFRTVDGGEVWTSIGGLYQDLNSISFANDDIGFIVADHGLIFKTTDSGNNWQRIGSGIYQLNYDLFDVSFVTLYTGWCVGENGVILHTTNGGVTFVEEDQTDQAPTEFLLSQNYPNPFNPSTKIKYSVPQSAQVIIKVYDILCNEIETLVSEEKPTGTYELTWNAASLPSGVYFYRLQAGDFVETKKMVLMK